MKTRLWESEAEAEEPTNRTGPGIKHCDWFVLSLSLATLTPTMQFSLDHKRWSHKRNQRSASDSVSLIFTRSYHIMSLYASDYDSDQDSDYGSDYDSVASENQPLGAFGLKERREGAMTFSPKNWPMPKWVSAKIGMQTLEKQNCLRFFRLIKWMSVPAWVPADRAPTVRLRKLLSGLNKRGHRLKEGASFSTYSRQIPDVSHRIRFAV